MIRTFGIFSVDFYSGNNYTITSMDSDRLGLSAGIGMPLTQHPSCNFYAPLAL